MSIVRFVAPWALLAILGCAAVPTADGERLRLTSDEFRDYVERVFREQNRVADALAFALEGWDPLESTCRHASLSIL